MSLHMKPLFEMVPLYDEQGMCAGYGVRRFRMEPGTAWCPNLAQAADTIKLMKEAEDVARFD